jgi:hypothetical protein
MSQEPKSTDIQRPGSVEEDEIAEDGVVNDSLGTIDSADSTGTDEDKETGEAKIENKDTRED